MRIVEAARQRYLASGMVVLSLACRRDVMLSGQNPRFFQYCRAHFWKAVCRNTRSTYMEQPGIISRITVIGSLLFLS